MLEKQQLRKAKCSFLVKTINKEIVPQSRTAHDTEIILC